MELLLFDCSHSQTPTEVHKYGEISATATDGNDENDDDTDAVASTFQSSLCEVEESDTSRNEEETDNNPGKKRASQAIARDKAVTRKVSKISNKEAAMQSSESLASAIRDASVTQGERRKQEMMLWLQHEAKEREEDRELEKLRTEMQEKESKRRFECEMMRFRGHQFTGPSQRNLITTLTLAILNHKPQEILQAGVLRLVTLLSITQDLFRRCTICHSQKKRMHRTFSCSGQ